tara:strand:+ start:1362 stop:4853 length:3492 start_codon:yes stop_codon:yes gene_type:complete
MMEETVVFVQQAYFLIPLAIGVGLMLLSTALFGNKKNANRTPTAIDMNTPSIQTTRGGVIPAVYGRRRVGATFGWVGNRYVVEEEVSRTEHDKCFVAGTEILTPFGPKAIEKIVKGDKVFAMDRRGNRVIRKVIKAHTRQAKEFIRLNMEDGSKIRVTPDHRFLVNEEWHPIEDAIAGDTLLHFDGRRIKITGHMRHCIEEEIDVYSLSIKKTKNYFAGGFCVHNIDVPEDTVQNQIVYYESGWHLVCCGPVSTINAIYEDGKGIASGHPGSFGQGALNSLANEPDSMFKVYWGNEILVPHGIDPDLAQFLPVAGEGSSWPNVCWVFWHPKRLGTFPRWKQFEYDVDTQSAGLMAYVPCDGIPDNYPPVYPPLSTWFADGCLNMGVGAAPMLHTILAAPYPLGLGIEGSKIDTNWLTELDVICGHSPPHPHPKWNMNILAQSGTEYQQIISQILADCGAMLVEQNGQIGPRVIRAGLLYEADFPLLTPEVLDPPLDEIIQSQEEVVPETVQFKFHQSDLGFRPQTIDIDNQAIGQFDKRRKSVSIDMPTVTSWCSGTAVVARRMIEGFSSPTAIKIKGARTMRDLYPGLLVGVPGIGAFRVTSITPHFDSAMIDAELILDVFSRQNIPEWIPDDGGVVDPPEDDPALPDIMQMFVFTDLDGGIGNDCVMFCLRVRHDVTVGICKVTLKVGASDGPHPLGRQDYSGVGGTAYENDSHPFPDIFLENDPDEILEDKKYSEGFWVGMHLNGDIPTKLLNSPYIEGDYENSCIQYIGVRGTNYDGGTSVEIMAVASWEEGDTTNVPAIPANPAEVYGDEHGRVFYKCKGVTRSVFGSTPVRLDYGTEIINVDVTSLTPLTSSHFDGTQHQSCKGQPCIGAGTPSCPPVGDLPWVESSNDCATSHGIRKIIGATGGGLPGNIETEFGGSGINIPTNGGLVEKTSGSETAATPFEGYMGSLDGYYRVYQGDASSTSSTSPQNELICLQWSYRDNRRSAIGGLMGAGRRPYGQPTGEQDKLPYGQFKVVLEGAGIQDTTNGDRLPFFNETPSNDDKKWTAWVEFAEWTLNTSDEDYRAAASGVVTFAIPRAKEKALLALYLNTDEETAVSNMLGLGGRNLYGDDLTIKKPRCRFKIQHWSDSILIGERIVYIRAIGTDGTNRYDVDDWWS